MLIENQFIKIRVTNNTEEHFNNLGYKVKNGDLIVIPVEHLSNGSGTKIGVICDYCGVPFTREWRKKLMSKDDCCKKCKNKKMMNTSLKRYGNVCSLQNPEIHNKVKKSNLLKYGVEYPLQNKQIYQKTIHNTINQSFINRITTKQQKFLYEIYGGQINYQIYPYIVDIFFEDEKFFFEYDGGGHNLRVKFGEITQEEFNRREQERTSFLKKRGLKEFRIIDSSKKGNLPSVEKLLDIKKKAFKILNYTENTTYIYNLDNNTETYYN